MIECENLRVGYHGKDILDGVSVSFPDNAITAIVGPNGSGKSTLVNAINQIVPIRGGNITIDGIPLSAFSPAGKARRIAILPQTNSGFPELEAETLVEQGRFPHLGAFGRMGDTDREAVRTAMRETDTERFRKTLVQRLSGGERQRVLMGMTLAQETDILVLDEPTTYLDIAFQRQFITLLREMKMLGKTVIVILHDLVQAIEVADFLVIMNRGKIAMKGTPEECLGTNVFERVFSVRPISVQGPDRAYIILAE